MSNFFTYIQCIYYVNWSGFISENLSLVRAIIAAGLYPNVARVVKPAYKHRYKPYETRLLKLR